MSGSSGRSGSGLVSQMLTLQLPNGPMNISISDIDGFYQYNTQCSISYGSQIGATFIMLLTVLLLSKSEKRRSAMFIVNTTLLVLNLVRVVGHAVYFTSRWSEFYIAFSGDVSTLSRGPYAISIMTTVLETLTLIVLETSLCMQVHIICVTVRKAWHGLTVAISVTVAINAIAFRIIYMVRNDVYIMEATAVSPIYWVELHSDIATTVSICWFALVFVVRLGVAIRKRRQLGMARFGPMEIIFLVGTQTLVIPGQLTLSSY